MSEDPSQTYLEAVIDSRTRTVNLAAGVVCRIGRGDQNTIVLAGTQVSRNHAMLHGGENGRVYLTDLGSRNGTFVNRRRVTTPAILHPGDRISIGGHEFVFHGPQERSAGPAPSARETNVDFSQRLITVLVADIRDFTGLSSRLPEVKLSELISTFNRESGRILNECETWAQKYIGDAVMATWLHEGDAPAARDVFVVFQALVGIFEVAAGLQDQFGLEAPIRIGAGINTGPACLGNIGSDECSDYTALSDAVNLSFRLESATKEMGCDLALGRKTYEFLESHVSVQDLFEPRTAQLKGYREPKPVYAASLVSAKAVVERLRLQLGVQQMSEASQQA